MVEHKFYRSGYDDVIFNLTKQSFNRLNEVITYKVPKVGTKQAPLTTSEIIMTITGVLVADDSKSAEIKAYEISTMTAFGAMINLQIETDIVRTWEGISPSFLFDIFEARTQDIKFTMKFKVDDYP